MKRVGTVQFLAKSGRLIIKAEYPAQPGQVLVDDTGRKIARVMELIGPTRAPYISAIPLTDRVKKVMGSPAYLHEERQHVREPR